MRRTILFSCLALAGAFTSTSVLAHPHVFIETKMTLVGEEGHSLSHVRNEWTIDELFASTLLFDFDRNMNGVLDDDEIAAVSNTLMESLGRFAFYTKVAAGGADIPVRGPDRLDVEMVDGKLAVAFDMDLQSPVDLRRSPVTVSVVDETLFFAFQRPEAEAEVVAFQHFDAACTHQSATPDLNLLIENLTDMTSSSSTQSVEDDPRDWIAALFSHSIEARCR